MFHSKSQRFMILLMVFMNELLYKNNETSRKLFMVFIVPII